jgi:hypothetical protein
MDKPVSGQRSTKLEKRRSDRFTIVSPVEVKWHESGGKIVVESAQATEVNMQGGLLQMKSYPRIGSQVELTGLLSHETLHARVVATREGREGQFRGVAVELLAPSATIWGTNFQLKKTSSELVKLGEAIRTGGIDARILTEFRDAVDYVRKTAWAVQEWQERELQQRDQQTVIPLLVTERIRRTTQLCNAITAEISAGQVQPDTVGLEELSQAVQVMTQRLAGLAK